MRIRRSLVVVAVTVCVAVGFGALASYGSGSPSSLSSHGQKSLSDGELRHLLSDLDSIETGFLSSNGRITDEMDARRADAVAHAILRRYRIRGAGQTAVGWNPHGITLNLSPRFPENPVIASRLQRLASAKRQDVFQSVTYEVPLASSIPVRR